MKDYWAILGVPRGASLEEIRRAYRRLAWQYHPDRNRGDATAEQRMREINEAYEVLSDPDLCARHERQFREAQEIRSRAAHGAQGRFWQAAGSAPYEEPIYEWDLGTVFAWIAGQPRRTSRWPFDQVSIEEMLWQRASRASRGAGLLAALLEMLLLYGAYRRRW